MLSMGNTEHRPLLIVIAGPNGSGKTSVTSRLLKHEWVEDSVYINPDIVAKDIFGDWKPFVSLDFRKKTVRVQIGGGRPPVVDVLSGWRPPIAADSRCPAG